jgi:hypothetical protein
MSKILTKNEFINKSKNIHGDKYDYYKVKYINSKTKVTIICQVHGEFNQIPSKHILGYGCPMCANNIRLNNKTFIEKSNKIHNNKYNYSLVKYTNMQTKVKIICPEHGVFEQTPLSHIHNESGCYKCSRNFLSKENFIIKSNIIHNNKYDYSLVDFIEVRDIIKIICPKHGVFEQSVSNHLYSKNGCMKCSIENKRLTKNEFIIKSNKIHNNKYDYSLSDYINCKSKVKIICSIHGEFFQKANSHLQGHGCKLCFESKGEKTIEKILNDNDIFFIRQYKFKECKLKQILPFDFYLPKHNVCIEFDGEQHFKPIEYWGGKKEFEKIKIRDNIKNEYCKNNNIKLLRISYNENILTKLKNKLLKNG